MSFPALKRRFCVLESKVAYLENMIKNLVGEVNPQLSPQINPQSDITKSIYWYQAWMSCDVKCKKKLDNGQMVYECPRFPFICLYNSTTELPFKWMQLPSWVTNASLEWEYLRQAEDGNVFWSLDDSMWQQQIGGSFLERIPPAITKIKDRIVNVGRIYNATVHVTINENRWKLAGEPETMTIEFLCLHPEFEGLDGVTIPLFFISDTSTVISKKLLYTESG